MNFFFLACGVVFWLLVLIILAHKLLNLPAAKRVLLGPRCFAFSRFLGDQYRGARLWLLGKLGLAAPTEPDVLRAIRATRYHHVKALRDALLRLDRLPTVEKGKKAMAIESIFDLHYRPAFTIRSEFSHPLQRPMFVIPGVPAIPFYENQNPGDHFPWAEPLEQAFPVIRKELLNLLENKGAGFQNYMAGDARVMPGWNAFTFFFFGKKFENNCALCPETTRILESLPRFEKDHIMFSALNPHTHIPLHFGPMNGILRVHLPLIVPDGCYLRVGGEERQVKEGKLMIFDDSFWHEAINHSDHLRIVLFLNFWHPCFSREEIEVLEDFRRAYELHPLAQRHAKAQETPRAGNLALAAQKEGAQ